MIVAINGGSGAVKHIQSILETTFWQNYNPHCSNIITILWDFVMVNYQVKY